MISSSSSSTTSSKKVQMGYRWLVMVMRQMLQPGPEHSNTTVPAMLYSPTPPSLREHNLGGSYKRKRRWGKIRFTTNSGLSICNCKEGSSIKESELTINLRINK